MKTDGRTDTTDCSTLPADVVVEFVSCMLRYDTIGDAVLTCAQKPIRASLIYRMLLYAL